MGTLTAQQALEDLKSSSLFLLGNLMPAQPSPLSQAGSVRLYLVHTNIYIPANARNWAFEPMTPGESRRPGPS